MAALLFYSGVGSTFLPLLLKELKFDYFFTILIGAAVFTTLSLSDIGSWLTAMAI